MTGEGKQMTLNCEFRAKIWRCREAAAGRGSGRCKRWAAAGLCRGNPGQRATLDPAPMDRLVSSDSLAAKKPPRLSPGSGQASVESQDG